MNKNQNPESDAINSEAIKVAMKKESFELPTLNQFMELVTGESSTIMATTSAYNVYNKYNKSS